jgi:Putative beta-barrel porin 2
MRRAKSDRIRHSVRRIAFSALFSIGCFSPCFAQSEPPLSVPLAGRLPGPSSGCDGLIGNPNLYGSASLYGNTTAASNGNSVSNANGNTSSASNVPLFTNLNPGVNVPLYGSPIAGVNVPLNSTPIPGVNAPLYSDSSFYSNSSLYGNYNRGGNAGPPVNGSLGSNICRSGIPIDSWLLYPSLRLYSLYSNNLFQTPTPPIIKALGFGVSPSLTAQWTNGIHTTTVYANIDSQIYPTENEINTFDKQVTFTQKYSPLPDLTFTALGDYTHKTISSSLTNSIPNQITTPTPAPILLPNGNIELPNGNIVSPTGQIVGQAVTAPTANGTTLVNPYDQYTGTFSVNKLFNRGTLTLSDSVARTNYETIQGGGFTSFDTNTLREDAAFWLGPALYVYSDGQFSTRTNNAGSDPNSSAYRVVGGIGTRQLGLFRSSLYFGYQGSETQGSGTAGGEVYGGKISYYPTLTWTITAAVDETINISSQTSTSTQALAVESPVQIPISSSTRITHPSLETQYQISPLWNAFATFSYTRIEYVNSPRLDNAWAAGATLTYEMWRNMTLTWQYQYTDIQSNAPFVTAQRNLVLMSANYRF